MSYQLPPEYKNSKKDIATAMRKAFEPNKNVDVSFEELSDLKKLEELIFGQTIEKGHSHFVMR